MNHSLLHRTEKVQKPPAPDWHTKMVQQKETNSDYLQLLIFHDEPHILIPCLCVTNHGLDSIESFLHII